ncbi:MAG: glycosyltransferase family 4 protein [Myxococcaceae bacterium]
MKRPPRRVLHVLNSASGGAAMSTLSLIRQLKRQGVASAAVCHDVGSPAEREDLLDACDGKATFAELYWWNKKTRAKWWKRPALEALQLGRTGFAMRSSWTTLRAAQEHGAELIHSNTVLTVEGGNVARALRLPHVWHVRELLGTLFYLRLEGAPLGRYLHEHASVMVANSKATAAPLEGLVEEDRLKVVYNGLDLSAFLALAPPKGPVKRVVMIANLTSRWKKHKLFIEVAARLRGRAEFVLYGAGADQKQDEYITGVVAAAEAAGVTLGGFAPPEQILANADLLVHPVDQESFGRTVVEAMAAARPVVGIDAGGVRETTVNEDSGLLAGVDDVEGLVRHTQRLLDAQPLRERLSAAGRARAKQLFSIESCADQMLSVYSQAMAFPLWSSWSAVSALLAG